MRLSEFSSGAHKDHGYHNCNVSQPNTVTSAHGGAPRAGREAVSRPGRGARTGSVKIAQGGRRGG
ncbi:hypothetical protein SFR_5686 [Streptomyces sp. FR-008]|nr:hypothetical protein SFR_5686 [Streptomyces sp. FR-008]